jgi:RNA polymerase sigma-54 factor
VFRKPQGSPLGSIGGFVRICGDSALTREIVTEETAQTQPAHYAEIARALGTTIIKVQNAATFISENLNPFPARAHWGDLRSPARPQ